jgi:putative transposase
MLKFIYSSEYRIYDQHGQYYVTITVEQWVNVFTRRNYINIVLESLRQVQKNTS